MLVGGPAAQSIMLRRVSLLGLWLEPLVSILWLLFLLWTVLVGAIWTTGFGEAKLDAWVSNLNLRHALVVLCKMSDSIWIALGAACAYLSVAHTHGVVTARRWALAALAGVALVLVASAWTGWPLGSIYYTRRLGVRLGTMPAGLPLLWLAVILGGRALWMRLFPRAGHGQIVFGAALFSLLTLLNLEPLASRLRGWWFWISPVNRAPIATPWSSYAGWFVAAALIAYLMREPRVIGARPGPSDRLIAILVLMNVVFLLTHVVRMVQG